MKPAVYLSKSLSAKRKTWHVVGKHNVYSLRTFLQGVPHNCQPPKNSEFALPVEFMF